MTPPTRIRPAVTREQFEAAIERLEALEQAFINVIGDHATRLDAIEEYLSEEAEAIEELDQGGEEDAPKPDEEEATVEPLATEAEVEAFQRWQAEQELAAQKRAASEQPTIIDGTIYPPQQVGPEAELTPEQAAERANSTGTQTPSDPTEAANSVLAVPDEGGDGGIDAREWRGRSANIQERFTDEEKGLHVD